MTKDFEEEWGFAPDSDYEIRKISGGKEIYEDVRVILDKTTNALSIVGKDNKQLGLFYIQEEDKC